jgi:hypothetical protein
MSEEQEAGTDDGVSIWGECGEFSVCGEVWRAWLTLAQIHGWKPAGTAPPDGTQRRRPPKTADQSSS